MHLFFFPTLFFTHMCSHSAGVWADVGAGKCEWFSTHLAEASHEGMVWDTYAYKLGRTRILHWHFINKPFVSVISSSGSGLTEVKGLRSVFSTSDLSNTRVMGPGSSSPNSAFCTGTLQYLSMKRKKNMPCLCGAVLLKLVYYKSLSENSYFKSLV